MTGKDTLMDHLSIQRITVVSATYIWVEETIYSILVQLNATL
jgi:hypothetical protein